MMLFRRLLLRISSILWRWIFTLLMIMLSGLETYAERTKKLMDQQHHSERSFKKRRQTKNKRQMKKA